MTPTGLEQPANSTGNTTRHKSGGADSGALSADCCTIDPDLATIIAAWPTLPDAIRRAMLALIG
jgi:hypothetical protein